MNHGKQLRLFLPDGTPSGPRYYELVNWTGQAVVMPVSRIKELVSGAWPEFERAGVYLVRGESEERHSRLYIGESENVAKRVKGQPSQLAAENAKSTKNIRFLPLRSLRSLRFKIHRPKPINRREQRRSNKVLRLESQPL